MRKHPIDSIDLKIEEIEPWVNEKTGHVGLDIRWSSNIGFGEYTFVKNSEEEGWIVRSECMDSQDDKEFGAALLKLWLDSAKAV